MDAAPSLAMVQFLTWASARPRRYAEARDAWTSTCPRLSLWEDAIIADLIRIVPAASGRAGDATVELTAKGRTAMAAVHPPHGFAAAAE